MGFRSRLHRSPPPPGQDRSFHRRQRDRPPGGGWYPVHDGHAQFCSRAMGAGFLHEVFVCAGEAGKPVKHRHFLSVGNLRWQVDGEAHSAAKAFGRMAVLFVPATKLLLLLRFSRVIGHSVAGGRAEVAGRPHHHLSKWITLRMLLPSCINSKASLMSSRPMVWVMKSFSLNSPPCR